MTVPTRNDSTNRRKLQSILALREHWIPAFAGMTNLCEAGALPFVLSLSKRTALPFVLSLSKCTAVPFVLSLSKHRPFDGAQGERLRAPAVMPVKVGRVPLRHSGKGRAGPSPSFRRKPESILAPRRHVIPNGAQRREESIALSQSNASRSMDSRFREPCSTLRSE